MKRVLIIVGKLYIGGAERVCRNIGYFADPTQFQVDYLVYGDEIGAYEPELLEKGCRIWHVPSPGAGYRQFYFGLKKLILANHYDIVHSHTMFNSGLVLRAAKRCGAPVRIAHSHSIRGAGKRSLIQTIYERIMRRWILRYATHYVGCGQSAGEWLFGRKAFREKGIVLLNGVDVEHFRYDPVVRERLRSDLGWKGAFLIGHAGHMLPVKNQLFLVGLMPELLKKQPNARLLLLGDGGDRSMLEQMVSDLNLKEYVQMPGNVSNVNEYLSAMDVFAFPSLYEGMPLAILEAQANGLPCVLSDRIPKDVFLTDLVQTLPLEDGAAWTQTLLKAERKDPACYADTLRVKGLDVPATMERIYTLYGGDA